VVFGITDVRARFWSAIYFFVPTILSIGSENFCYLCAGYFQTSHALKISAISGFCFVLKFCTDLSVLSLNRKHRRAEQSGFQSTSNPSKLALFSLLWQSKVDALAYRCVVLWPLKFNMLQRNKNVRLKIYVLKTLLVLMLVILESVIFKSINRNWLQQD